MTESFAKKVLHAGAQLETEAEQRAFRKGIDFTVENIWHDADELPDENKCVFAYNPETDAFDFAYYKKVGKGYRWAYVEDFFTTDMVKALQRHAREADGMYR